MVKFSKKNIMRGGKKTKKNSLKRKRSKVMKKEGHKKNTKVNANQNKNKLQSNKERTLYCLVCKQKVKVNDYNIKEMKNGALQVVATCPRAEHKVNKDGKKLVFGFISRSSL